VTASRSGGRWRIPSRASASVWPFWDCVTMTRVVSFEPPPGLAGLHGSDPTDRRRHHDPRDRSRRIRGLGLRLDGWDRAVPERAR
jgi:hypothetical protein